MLEEITNSNARLVPLEISGGHDSRRAPIAKAEPERRMTGVYRIYCVANGKSYIGSAARCFLERWRSHKNKLRIGKHHSLHLQAAWNKYGETNFIFCIVKICAPSDCVLFEQMAIDGLQSAYPEFGFNVCPTAGSPLGRKHTSAAKEKIRTASIGRKHPPRSKETLALMSKAQIGRRHTDEAKEKISNSSKARKYPDRKPEWRAKLSAAMKGRKLSEERCAQISASLTGRKRAPFTAEHLANMSKAFKGKKMPPRSATHRINLALSLKAHHTRKAKPVNVSEFMAKR